MKRKRKYDLVIFDFDDTLFDYAKTEAVALKLTLNDLHIEFKNFYQDLFKNINRQAWDESQKNDNYDKTMLRIKRFETFFQKIGYDADQETIKKASQLYLDHSKEGAIIDGVEETIKALSDDGFILVVASSGLSDTRKSKLENSGLMDYFSDLFFREAFKPEDLKPNPEFYNFICNKYPRIDRSRIIAVGNSYSNDIVPAKEAGIETAFFNYFHVLDREIDMKYCDCIFESDFRYLLTALYE